MYGVVKDVLVKVDKFIFPVNFVVMDIEEDKEVPLILCKPFMETTRVIIDVDDGNLKVRAQNDEVTFNVFEILQPSNERKDCLRIYASNEAFSETKM